MSGAGPVIARVLQEFTLRKTLTLAVLAEWVREQGASGTVLVRIERETLGAVSVLSPATEVDKVWLVHAELADDDFRVLGRKAWKARELAADLRHWLGHDRHAATTSTNLCAMIQ